MYLYCHVYVFLLYVYVFLLLCMCCILFHCVVLCKYVCTLDTGFKPS